METWKELDRTVLSHSAAHHLTAIAELRDSHGYARVSDVARALAITRGSASITLKSLKQKGFVEEDENRFLLLSDQGRQIAEAVRAKRFVIKKLLVDLLGVDAEQADRDTCKIEHLISSPTAQKVTRLLRYLRSGNAEVRGFLAGLESFEDDCGHEPDVCPCCTHECLADQCED